MKKYKTIRNLALLSAFAFAGYNIYSTAMKDRSTNLPRFNNTQATLEQRVEEIPQNNFENNPQPQQQYFQRSYGHQSSMPQEPINQDDFKPYEHRLKLAVVVKDRVQTVTQNTGIGYYDPIQNAHVNIKIGPLRKGNVYVLDEDSRTDGNGIARFYSNFQIPESEDPLVCIEINKDPYDSRGCCFRLLVISPITGFGHIVYEAKNGDDLDCFTVDKGKYESIRFGRGDEIMISTEMDMPWELRKREGY